MRTIHCHHTDEIKSMKIEVSLIIRIIHFLVIFHSNTLLIHHENNDVQINLPGAKMQYNFMINIKAWYNIWYYMQNSRTFEIHYQLMNDIKLCRVIKDCVSRSKQSLK